MESRSRAAAPDDPAPARPLGLDEGPPLAPSSRRILLALARAAVEATVTRAARPRAPAIVDGELPEELLRPFPAFVTLTEQGELRGCMGRLDEDAAVWENVVAAAATAAVGDPRFDPLDAAELDSIELEISVLSAPLEIADPEQFDPLRHGIVVERGSRRGLLLPQVARERGWGRRETLEAACWKAGLAPDAWRDPGTRLSVFTATVFDEADLADLADETDRADEADEADATDRADAASDVSTRPPDPA